MERKQMTDEEQVLQRLRTREILDMKVGDIIAEQWPEFTKIGIFIFDNKKDEKAVNDVMKTFLTHLIISIATCEKATDKPFPVQQVADFATKNAKNLVMLGAWLNATGRFFPQIKSGGDHGIETI